MHRYFYANANPARYVDPTGHFSIKDFGKGALNVVAEPFRIGADIAVAGIATHVMGIDSEDIQLNSMLGKSQQSKLHQGKSLTRTNLEGSGEVVFGVATLGIGPALVQHYQLAKAYNAGQITIDEYDAALSEMAGGQTAAAVMAKLGTSRSSARASTEIQVQPKGAGAIRVIEGNRGAATVPDGPVIEMVPNGEGVYVPAFEAPGAGTALALGRQPALLAASEPLALPAGAQPRALLSAGSLNDTIASNYQRYYNDAGLQVVDRFNQGNIRIPAGMSWPTVLGQHVDAAARARLQNFLSGQGIAEGPQQAVSVNRWLRDPSGSGRHRIPDLLLRDSRQIFDGTIGRKALTDPQAIDFAAFSGGYSVNFVNPQVGPLSKLRK